MITSSLAKSIGVSSLRERFNPLCDILNQMQKMSKSMKYASTSLHTHSVSHSVIHNQLFEVFRHLTYAFEEVIREKVVLSKGNNQVPCFFLIEETRDSINFNSKYVGTKLAAVEDEYKKLFDYPSSFIRKQLPRLSGVFTGFSPDDFNDEFPWVEKIKIFDAQTRGISTKDLEFRIPRNILIQFYITTEEICILSYNLQEELFLKLQKKFDEFADWANRRYRLMQVVINDRIALKIQNINKKRTKRESVLIKRMDSGGFINMINRPLAAAIPEAAFQKWGPNRIFKQTSNTNLADLATNYTKSVQCYAKNLFLDVNKQKNLLPFEGIVSKVTNNSININP